MEDPYTATRRLQGAAGELLEVDVAVTLVRVRGGRQAGRTFVFDALPVVIGADPGCDLVLDDPGVSRRHASLRADPGGLLLRDEGSTNGTLVGGARVREAVLDRDTVVRVGEVELAVELDTDRRKGRLETTDAADVLVGESRPMRELRALLRAVAPSPANVLVLGETGTGKELVAQALHALGDREGPLVRFDSTQCEAGTLRSDLFGHVKGAFTGADRDREGALRAADGGTFFLDEVGELPLDIQARLLRALESREVTPMGADRAVPTRFRLVAATHRDLPARVAAGEFREDLLYRLAVIVVRTPPLRERVEDLPALVTHLAAPGGAVPDLGDAAWEALRAHPWPGNVRELRNVVERIQAQVRGRAVTPADLGLGASVPGAAPASAPAAIPPGPASSDLADQRAATERVAIEEALARHDGHRERTAADLGISAATLWRKMKRLGIP